MASDGLLSRLAPALLVAGLLLSPAARAAPTAEDKETARHLMKVGDQKLASKDYQGALRAYETAHTIMGVPTTGVAVARARIGLGQLVEARELLLDVARSPTQPGEPAPFAEARRDAQTLGVGLEAGIPSLLISVQGPPSGAPLEISIDGHAVPVVGLSTTRKVNPGEHVVTASADGYATASSKVTVPERETRASLRLAPAARGSRQSGRLRDLPRQPPRQPRRQPGPTAPPRRRRALRPPRPDLHVGLTPRSTSHRRLRLVRGRQYGSPPRRPLAVRVTSPRFAVSAGLAVGYATVFARGEKGFSGGPEWSLLSLRLGDKREWEFDFSQGFRFGNTPVEYHNGFVLTYLFLDDEGT
jgi:hypothetical protein